MPQLSLFSFSFFAPIGRTGQLFHISKGTELEIVSQMGEVLSVKQLMHTISTNIYSSELFWGHGLVLVKFCGDVFTISGDYQLTPAFHSDNPNFAQYIYSFFALLNGLYLSTREHFYRLDPESMQFAVVQTTGATISKNSRVISFGYKAYYLDYEPKALYRIESQGGGLVLTRITCYNFFYISAVRSLIKLRGSTEAQPTGAEWFSLITEKPIPIDESDRVDYTFQLDCAGLSYGESEMSEYYQYHVRMCQQRWLDVGYHAESKQVYADNCKIKHKLQVEKQKQLINFENVRILNGFVQRIVGALSCSLEIETRWIVDGSTSVIQ